MTPRLIPERGSLASRSLFALATLTLAVGTHWPDFTLDSTLIDRPDLVVHLGSFALWSTLLLRATALHRGAALLIALVFITVDETSQVWVGRTVALSDWLANAAGLGIGFALDRLTASRAADSLQA